MNPCSLNILSEPERLFGCVQRVDEEVGDISPARVHNIIKTALCSRFSLWLYSQNNHTNSNVFEIQKVRQIISRTPYSNYIIFLNIGQEIDFS